MSGFDLFGRGLVSSNRVRPVMESVHLITMVLDPFLLTFRSGTFRFPVTAVADLPETSLPLGGTLSIEVSRLTVHTIVDFRHVATMIVALDMLPSLAPFAKDRVAIVIFKCADAFDGIRLLLVRGGRVGNGAVEGG
jgi:hypothetical protein